MGDEMWLMEDFLSQPLNTLDQKTSEKSEKISQIFRLDCRKKLIKNCDEKCWGQVKI